MRREEFDQLFYEHAGPLLAFLTYRLGDRPTAEDLLADAFERALRSRKRFDPERGDAKAWLYSIALNLARDHLRRSAVERRVLDEVAQAPPSEPPEPASSFERRETVAEALAFLSAEEREAIALRYGADLTVPEIAELLKLPLSTMEGRVYRSLAKLRAHLAD